MADNEVSYSQLDSYQTCGARFFYERVQKVPTVPTWAQIGGSAMHSATEVWDRWEYGDEGVDVDKPFSEFFEEATREQEERTGLDRAVFKATGRKSKDWPEKEGPAWWEHHGPTFVAKWKDWRRLSNWEIYVDQETMEPAIELSFKILMGDALVRGFIDRVFITPDGTLVVVDLKSGREPVSAGQLGLYAVALQEIHGLPVDLGTYWMARTGQSVEAWSLGAWSRKRLEYEYQSLVWQKQQGIYLAHPSSLCGSCGVRDFCPSMGGVKAGEIDQPWDLVTR